MVLCDPIKRLKSDFVHTTKTTEPHAKRIKSYSKIEETVQNSLNTFKKFTSELLNFNSFISMLVTDVRDEIC